MKNSKERALDAFMGTVGAINEKLEALQGYMDDHMYVGPDAVNWGHVGSAEHILQLLTEVCQFAGLEKEVA